MLLDRKLVVLQSHPSVPLCDCPDPIKLAKPHTDMRAALWQVCRLPQVITLPEAKFTYVLRLRSFSHRSPPRSRCIVC